MLRSSFFRGAKSLPEPKEVPVETDTRFDVAGVEVDESFCEHDLQLSSGLWLFIDVVTFGRIQVSRYDPTGDSKPRRMRMLVRRPRIVIHIAQSIDARISTRLGLSKWEQLVASSAPDAVKLWGRVLREINPDVLLAGSETLLVGKSRQSTRHSRNEKRSHDFLPQEIVEAVRRRKNWSGWQAVVDSKGRVRWGIRERTFWGKDWHPLALVSDGTPSNYLSMLQQKMIPYLVSGSDRIDLGQSLTKLHTKLGVDSVVCLGGGRLNGALLRAGLFHELSIVLVPMIFGGEYTPTSFDAAELKFEEMPTFLRLISTEGQEDGSIWLRYSRKD